MKPNPSGIELVERLTGIDMSGIVVDGRFLIGTALSNRIFAEWVQCLQPSPGDRGPFATLFANFQQYHIAHQANNKTPTPSGTWFCKQLRNNEYLFDVQALTSS